MPHDPRWPSPGRFYLSSVDPFGDPVSTPVSDRPDPIGNAVKTVGSAVSALLGVVAFLVQYGILTPTESDALNAAGQVVVTDASPLGSIVSGLFVAFSGVVAAFAAGKVAKQKTTPTDDPRDNLSRPLVPAAVVTGTMEG